MNKSIVMVLLLTSCFSFAADPKRSPAAELPASVKALASKIESEVRTRVSVYNVSAKQANACSEEGVHYNIKLQVKKAIRAMDKDGNPVIKSTWETVREVDTNLAGEAMEICAE